MDLEPDGNWLPFSPTGKVTAVLAITAGYWRRQNSGGRYAIAARAYPAGVSSADYGVAYFAVEVASPPVAGNCTANPPNGTALSTRFNITCDDFLTINTPLSYQIGYSVDGVAYMWVRSGFPFEAIGQGLTLPKGAAATNFTLLLAVKATDSIGMFATSLLSAQVNSPSSAELSGMLTAMNDVSGLSAMGIDPANPIEALAFVGAVSFTLNDLSEVGHGNNTKADRRQVIAARGTLTSVLAQTEVADPATVIGVQGLLGNVFKNYDQVNAEMRSSGVEVLKNSAEAVANLSKDAMSGAQMSEALSATISSAGSLLMANKYSSENRNSTGDDISGNVTAVLKTMADAALLKVVAGEDDIVTSTPVITMIASKKYSTEIAKGKFEDGRGNSLAILGIAAVSNETSNPLVIKSQINVFHGDFFLAASNKTSVDSGVVMAVIAAESPKTQLNTEQLPQPVHVFSSRSGATAASPNVRGTAMPYGQKKATVHKIQLTTKGSMHLAFEWFQNTSSRAVNGSTSPGPTEAATEYSLVVYMSVDRVPRPNSHDFNCTLPLVFGVNQTTNKTVVSSGGVYSSACFRVKPVDRCSGEHVSADLSLFPNDDAADANSRACYLPASLLQKVPGKLLFASVRYIRSSQSKGNTESSLTIIEEQDLSSDNVTIEYEAYSFTQSCYYWNPGEKLWKTDMCWDGPLTSLNISHCLCNRLSVPSNDTSASNSGRTRRSSGAATESSSGAQAEAGIAFGSGLTLSINTVNLSDSAFNHLDDNPLLFSVLISIISIYLCSLVWAIKMDRLDAWKSGAQPLVDNDPSDKYLYEVIVYTGNMLRAGTTANVCVIFGGDGGDSAPRLFCGQDRRVFQRGGVDSFVMAVPKSLGSLTYVRVWHDNAGTAPSWFLSRIIVTDLQTSHKFYFIVNKWLSESDDDCQRCRVVNVAGRSDMSTFTNVFWIKARKDLLDGHLWFSVVGKPHASHFTREQRCTCCITLLFSLMTANIMFFNKLVTTDIVVKVGPLALSVGHVLQGLIASLVVLPVNIAVVQIFRKSEPMAVRRIMKVTKSKVASSTVASLVPNPLPLGSKNDTENAATLIKNQSAVNTAAEDPLALWRLAAGSRKTNGSSSPGIMSDTIRQEIQAASVTGRLKRQTNLKRKRLLPWWCAFIAYGLCAVTCAVSFWYVVEIGNVLGQDSATKWLIAFVSSVIESVCLSQPIKVMVKVVLFTLIIKRPAQDDESVMHRGKRFDYLDKHLKLSQTTKQTLSRKMIFNIQIPSAPAKETVQAVERLRIRHRESLEIVKEVVVYMVFVALMMMTSYGNLDVNSESAFRYVENYVRLGLGEQSQWVPTQLDRAHDYGTTWSWLSHVALPFLYGCQPRANGSVYLKQESILTPPFYLIRQPRVRQKRLLRGQECSHDFANRSLCFGEYYGSPEDSRNYGARWNLTAGNNNQTYAQAWRWNTGGDDDSVTLYGQGGSYSGSGFAVELGRTFESAQQTLNYLQNNDWLDQRTRAVVLEFSMYNPNVNLVAVSFVLIEFLPIGITRPNYGMVFVRYEAYLRDGLMTTLVAEIGSVIFFLYFACNELSKVRRLKKEYVKSLTNNLNMITLLLCMVVILMFISKVSTMEGMKAKLTTSGRGGFLNLQSAAFWSECYRSCLGLTTFVVTLKFLRLLRFNNRISMLATTLKLVMKSLLSFMLLLVMVFMAFAHTTMLIFGSTLQIFTTLSSTCEHLIVLMLNKFDYVMLQTANPIYAPIFISGFVIIINFVMLNVMMTIIMEGFQETRQSLRTKRNKQEILNLVIDLFKTSSGFGASQAPRQPELKAVAAKWRNMIKKKDVVRRSATALAGPYAEVYLACERFEKVVDNFINPNPLADIEED